MHARTPANTHACPYPLLEPVWVNVEACHTTHTWDVLFHILALHHMAYLNRTIRMSSKPSGLIEITTLIIIILCLVVTYLITSFPCIDKTGTQSKTNVFIAMRFFLGITPLFRVLRWHPPSFSRFHEAFQQLRTTCSQRYARNLRLFRVT